MKLIILSIYILSTSLFDIKYKKIPIPLLISGSLLAVVYNVFYGNENYNVFSFIPGIIMFIISIISHHSLGIGDCAFILTLGLLLDIYEIAFLLLFALFSVSLFGLFMFIKYRNIKQQLPFIPFLLPSLFIMIIT